MTPPYCEADSCKSVGLWQPTLLVWGIEQDHLIDKPMRVKLDAPTCVHCKTRMTVDDLLSDDEFSAMSKMMADGGGPSPDRSTIKIDWYGE